MLQFEQILFINPTYYHEMIYFHQSTFYQCKEFSSIEPLHMQRILFINPTSILVIHQACSNNSACVKFWWSDKKIIQLNSN